VPVRAEEKANPSFGSSHAVRLKTAFQSERNATAPGSTWWINLLEEWFAEIFRSVKEPETSIPEYPDVDNQVPKLFITD